MNFNREFLLYWNLIQRCRDFKDISIVYSEIYWKTVLVYLKDLSLVYYYIYLALFRSSKTVSYLTMFILIFPLAEKLPLHFFLEHFIDISFSLFRMI